MPTIPIATLAKIGLVLTIIAGVGLFSMHFYNAGKVTQAGKDQPKVTQAVVGEIAAGVASGVSLGASQSNTTRLTKAQDTRKVSKEAEEVLKNVLQQLPSSTPTGTRNPGQGEDPSPGPMEAPETPLAGPSSLGIPDSVADAYLSGLQRVRDSGTSGPTAFHKCSGNAGAWLICS